MWPIELSDFGGSQLSQNFGGAAMGVVLWEGAVTVARTVNVAVAAVAAEVGWKQPMLGAHSHFFKHC